MAVQSLTDLKQDMITKKLETKEKEGFQFGEVRKFLEKVADEFDATFNQVKTIYYEDVRQEKSPAKPRKKEVTKVLVEADKNDEHVHSVININDVDMRIALHNGKKYFVAKDFFDSSTLNRYSSLVVDCISEQDKQIVYMRNNGVKSKTSLLSVDAICLILNVASSEHTNPFIKDRCNNIIKYMKDNNLGFIDLEDGKNSKEEVETQTVVEQEITENSENQTIVEGETENEKPVRVGRVAMSQTETLQMEEKEMVESFKSNVPNYIVPPYKTGQQIEVVVTSIAHTDKFALVETQDMYKQSGMIHISDVVNGFVHGVSDYFEIGDRLLARVTKHDKRFNRLNLTTRHLKLKPKGYAILKYDPTATVEIQSNTNNVLGEKLSQLKDQIQVTETIETNEGKPVIAEARKEEVQTTINMNVNVEVESEDVERIVKKFRKIVGVVSPKAREVIAQTISEYDMFDFGEMFGKVVADFEPDMGLLLINEVKDRLKIGEHL
jgi:predicted RNA-binding protein with RPS1 domain